MTRKNYCNNCKEYKKSWADKLGSHHSDSRCWECNKYTLDKSKVQVTQTRTSLKETSSCSLYDDGTCGVKNTYYNEDGSSTVTYLRQGKKKMYKSQISSPRNNVTICTVPEQTAYNVEYKKPGPCRIM